MKMFFPGKIGCFVNMAYQTPSEKDEISTNLSPKFRFDIIQNDLDVNNLQLNSNNDTDFNFGQLKYSDNIYEEFIKNPTVFNIHTDPSGRSPRENYCRLCASIVPASCLTPLSDSKDGISFIDKIKFCFSEKVQVHVHDGLPQEICNSCIVQLNAFNKILASIIKANLKLQKLFKSRRLPVVEVKDNCSVIHTESNPPVNERNTNPPVKQKELNLPMRVTVLNSPVTQMIANRSVTQRVTNPSVTPCVTNSPGKQMLSNLSVTQMVTNPSVIQKIPNSFPRKSVTNLSVMQKVLNSSPTQRVSNPPVIQNVNNLSVRPTVPKRHVKRRVPDPPLTLRMSNAPRVYNPSVKKTVAKPLILKGDPNRLVRLRILNPPVIQTAAKPPIKQTESGLVLKVLEPILPVIEIDPNPSVNETELDRFVQVLEPSPSVRYIEPNPPVQDIEPSPPVQDIEPSPYVQDIEPKSSMIVESTPVNLLAQRIQQTSDHLEIGNSEGSSNNNTLKTSIKIKYQCMSCQSLFETKEKVVQHFISTHPIPAQRKILCKVIKTEVNESDTKPSVSVSEAPNVTEEKPVINDKAVYGISYQCLLCSFVFQRKDAFIKHTLRRHQALGKNRFACKIVKTRISKNGKLCCTECNAFFSSYKLYRKHMRQHGLYKCVECNLSFDRMYKLKMHSKTHKPQQTFPCAVCKKVFNTKRELIMHGATHYTDKLQNTETEFIQEKNEYFKPGKFRCTTCFEVFDSPFSVRKHQRVHESCLCNQCGKLFASSNYLQKHILTHSDQRPFSCNTCLKSFKTMPSLSKHRRTHDNERNFICQHCGKLFRTMQVLRQHVLTHSSFKPHACDICGVTFHRRSNMIKHRKCHESLAFNTQQCKICMSTFPSLKALQSHVAQHMGADEQPLLSDIRFECETCKKQFTTQKQCEIHARIHSDERPYACDVCGKCFRTSASLRQHKLIHGDVFPHECNYCDRKFRRLQSLIVHRKTHTGEKPHACPECGRAFANRGDMIKHRRIHMRSLDASKIRPLSHTNTRPKLPSASRSLPAL